MNKIIHPLELERDMCDVAVGHSVSLIQIFHLVYVLYARSSEI